MRLGEFQETQPVEGRLRLQVQVVSVCGSDIHYYKEGRIGSAAAEEPFVLGHEFSALVDDPDGERWGLPAGTLVAVDPAEPCGVCEWCSQGYSNLCPHVRFAGSAPVAGALREYYYAKPSSIFPVPDGFDATAAALLEPLGVAIHGVDLAKIRLGDTVAVVGAGAIGLYLLQVARLTGAFEILVLEPLAYRRELALRLGADAAYAQPEALLEATAGRGADVVLEATDSPEGPEAACAVARIGGRVVLVGIPDGDRFTLTASMVRRKGLSLKLSRRMGHVYPRAIQMVASQKVNLESIVTHHFSLEQGPQAFALQARRNEGVIKSVIHVASANR
jgi:L-iditol 2-dehydrogenase